MMRTTEKMEISKRKTDLEENKKSVRHLISLATLSGLAVSCSFLDVRSWWWSWWSWWSWWWWQWWSWMWGPAIIDLFVMTIMIILDVRSDWFVWQGNYKLQITCYNPIRITIMNYKWGRGTFFKWLPSFSVLKMSSSSQSMNFSSQKVFGWLQVFCLLVEIKSKSSEHFIVNTKY